MSFNNKIPKLAIVASLLMIVLTTTYIYNKNQQNIALKDIIKTAGEQADRGEQADKADQNPIEIDAESIKNTHNNIETLSTTTSTLNELDLNMIALSVTVRIFAQELDREIGGSGVIIGKRNQEYLVVTNNHVVNNTELSYYIQTYSGETYPAKIIRQNNQDLVVDDLALMRFSSEREYQVINVKNDIIIQPNEYVFASGFPFDKNRQQAKKINHTIGNIKMILPSPLIGGYQFGYTNTVYNGMSGGSILNSQGELIGLNGLGKSPALGNPYIYKDGSHPQEKQLEKMDELSWGIPSKYINMMIDEILAEYKENKTSKKIKVD